LLKSSSLPAAAVDIVDSGRHRRRHRRRGDRRFLQPLWMSSPPPSVPVATAASPSLVSLALTPRLPSHRRCYHLPKLLPLPPAPFLLPPSPAEEGGPTTYASPSQMASGSTSPPSEPEAQLKRPPQFQELFDETHKKKGTDDCISEKAREVAESYNRGMDERYGYDSQHP
ncbi:hypothetical protein Taro_029345, partial [Colocasia esculenta]|nr:hypothetical protein [Colocasia esculenta]